MYYRAIAGWVIGVIFSALRLPLPVPPLPGLVGLFGMFLGGIFLTWMRGFLVRSVT